LACSSSWWPQWDWNTRAGGDPGGKEAIVVSFAEKATVDPSAFLMEVLLSEGVAARRATEASNIDIATANATVTRGDLKQDGFSI
jgi:hypothetical protein